MASYRELKDQYKELAKKRTIKTPDDLTEILDEIDLLFSKYGYSTDESEKKQLLDDIQFQLQHYTNIYNIIYNVEASVTPYSHDNLLFDVDNDEDLVIPKSNYGINGEFILEKLHRDSGLRDKDNTIHRLFVETLGRWLDEWNTVDQVRQYNLRFATGKWLDELASNFGIYRLKNESDDDLKERIYQRRSELFTVPTLKSHDVTFFTCVKDPKTQLTSKNTYLSNDYLCYAKNKTEEFYDENYICWRDIIWL